MEHAVRLYRLVALGRLGDLAHARPTSRSRHWVPRSISASSSRSSLLWLNLLRTVPARIAAGVQYLQPLIGVAAASAIFGDRLGIAFIAGATFVLVGLALAEKSRS